VPAPLSLDLRRRVVQAYLDGEGTYEEIAARFELGRATVNRYLRLERNTGSVAAKPVGGSKSILTDEDMESIHLIVFDQPDITLAELRERFIADGGAPVGKSTLCRGLVRLGMTRKKSRSSTTGAWTRT
jgi:transposase